MADETDPFAPVTGLPPEKAAKDREVWEPQLPAPVEPPDAGAIRHSRFGVAVARWVYRDAAGAPLFCTVRFEHDGKKEVLPFSYGRRRWTTQAGRQKDETSWQYKRPAEPVPLYGLDRLAAAPGATVVVCEGEKAADAATALFPSHVAITPQGGSKAPAKSDWSAVSGRDVVLWPDADEPGWKFARLVAELVEEAGAASVRIVQAHPTNWPPGWDLADEMPGGIDQDRLRAMLDEAEVAEEGETLDAPPDAPAIGPEDTAAEIERLSLLPSADYARQRKRAAQAMTMGVGDLDRACAAVRGRRRKAAEAEHRSKDVPGNGTLLWPLGFFVSDDGLFFDSGSDAGPTWIGDPIEVLGQGRDGEGSGWGLYIRWRDADHRTHDWGLPNRLLTSQPGELEAVLLDGGYRMNIDQNARGQLRQALAGVRTSGRVSFAPAPGWAEPVGGERVFALIDGQVIGTSSETVVLKSKPENATSKMRERGSLAGWQNEVAALTVGNPVATFAICAAFSGPLLHLLGEASGGFHFHGRSKAGKTLALKVGLSVWGNPEKSGLLKDWRSTANALEGAAEECNDGFLTLDEIHQAEPREVVGAIYQLANESGKARLTREAVSRQRRTWRCMVLSCGEVDIAAVASKASSTPLPAGAEVRVPSIPIDAMDMWPCLHGELSPEALMMRLRRGSSANHGNAIRAFLAELVDQARTQDGSLEAAFEACQQIVCSNLPPDADAQVRDVARRCALVAVAGEVATERKILPWASGDAINAARKILALWVGRREGTGSTEESQHVRTVRAYLSEHGASRFVALDWTQEAGQAGRWTERHPDRPVLARSGWRRTTADGEEYLLDRDGWARMCATGGADPSEVAKTLNEAKLLDPGEGKNLAKRLRLPGMGLTRCYVVRSDIFDTSAAVASEAAA